MNIRNNIKLQNRLAAEYVLGTLRGGARRRFDTWLKNEAYLQQVVREWQAHLIPMAELTKGNTPNIQVWKNIEKYLAKHLHIERQQSRQLWSKLIDNLQFWRGLTVVATSASILLAVFILKPNDGNFPVDHYVASMVDDQAQAVAVISGDRQKHQLLVRFVKRPTLNRDQSLELWSISKEGKVRSLGLVAHEQTGDVVRVAMPDTLTPETTALLAISLEPKGGSANPEKPSGPILFKGNWLKFG
ncbi:MAG: anti-sigma factor [Undibacterium sp.]|nr:anti-sigma factor [Undibacterium sp.]